MSSSPHFGTGQTHLNSDAKIADEGRPQGAPLPIVFSRRYALGRAPTRGAPTNCLLSALCPGEGTHKGRPYRLSSLGVMAWGGHPQGAPLPIVFSRRYALGRAPTRGAPTNCLLSALCPGEGTHKGAPTDCGPGEGAHKGRPYRLSSLGVMALGRAPTRGAPTDCLLSALWPGEGTHKGRPYRLSFLGVIGVMPGEGAHKGRPYRLSSLGVMAPQGGPIVFSRRPWGGHPQGAPLPIVFSRRYALGRAPTRGAPTDCLSLGVMAWGGHPQGAPLPIVFGVMPFSALWPGEGAHKGRYALGRAPTRGAPTDCLSRRYGLGRGAPYCLLSALWPGEGTHKGRPYCLLSALWPGEGAHKGRPYRLSSLGVMAWGGRPQGAPLPIVFSRRYGLGRAPTRGAPTDCLLSALWPGEGAHKGRPYRFGVMAWGGHPQGAPLPIVFSRRYGLGRAPTRGAPTDCLLSALWPWGGHPQGAPLPIVFSRRYGLGRAPTRGAPMAGGGRYGLGRAPTRGAPTDLGVMPWGGHPQGAPLPIALPWGGHPQGAPLPIRYALGRAPTRGAPTRFRQPHVGLSQFDAIALHFGMHPAAMGRAGAQFGSPRSCCKGNRRRL